MPLQREIWIAGIQENPIPDTSFISASVDMSEYVDANALNLAEAGVDPDVYEDFFEGNEDGELPIQDIKDIPNKVLLKTYSTARTRHRSLEEIELYYKKKESVLNRHRNSLANNIGRRGAYEWTTDKNNPFNKLINLSPTDSVIDAVIDCEAFFSDLDKLENLNICFNSDHMSRIKKEDKKLYKEIIANPKDLFYGFKIWRYSKTPIFTESGTKKPIGAIKEKTDKKASFLWCSDEVFRCSGDTEMFDNLRDSATQADTISFAQRMLVGKIRAKDPKYLATII